jgi:hypothetical protein
LKAKGGKVAQQNLDFNIAANVKGMEAIATLINRVGALEAETKKLASANSALSTSTEAVIRNGTRYNNALDAQSKELRNARQGTQQLGMQFNDFATSVATGASVSQAFSQQIGQVGYAMSMMGGTAGRIGNFLAGPWGAAVMIGAIALQPIIDKLFQSEAAAKKAADAHYKYLDAVAAGSMADLIRAEGELTKMQQKRLELQIKLGKTNLPGGQMGDSRFAPVPGERRRIQDQINQIDQEIRWQQLAIDRGNEARERIASASQRAESNIRPSRGGGGRPSGQSAIQEAEQTAERLAEIQRDIERIRYKGDQAMREELEKLSNDQEAKLQETLKSAEEMGMAAAQTLSDKVIKPFITQLEELDKSYQRIGGAVSDAFKGMLTGAMSWKDGMRGIINAVIDELWRLYVVQQIVGMVTKFLGAIGLPVPGLAGARAAGGPVSANKPYLVGEKGPEIVVPGKSGTVIPNRSIGQTGGGGGTIINVDARGASDPAAVRAQVQQGIIEAAPSIIAAAQATTIKSLRRPRLGGAIK